MRRPPDPAQTRTPGRPRWRRWIGPTAAIGILGIGALLFVDQRQSTRVVPALVAVEKAARRLTLLRAGRLLATDPVSLGLAPVGRKSREGDGRTPEGVYTITYRNPCSVAHLSLKVSYRVGSGARIASWIGSVAASA